MLRERRGLPGLIAGLREGFATLWVYPPEMNATYIVLSFLHRSQYRWGHTAIDLASGSTVGFACVAPGAPLCYTANVATRCGHFTHDLDTAAACARANDRRGPNHRRS